MSQAEQARDWLQGNIELFLAIGYQLYLQYGRGGIFLTFTSDSELPQISYFSLEMASKLAPAKGFAKNLQETITRDNKNFIKDCNNYDPEVQCLAIIGGSGYRIKSMLYTPAECYAKYGPQLSDFIVTLGCP